jgi:hypothetical protein
VRKDLLYAGTETGVYVSFDGGARWQPLGMDLPGETGDAAGATAGRLPIVPITDLVVEGNDLVVATQGRSFWILDDVGPLRQGAAAAEVRLFAPSPALRFFSAGRPQPGLGRNPPNGAIVYYSLSRAPKDDEEVTLEFLDASGAVLRKLSSQPKADPAAGGGDEEDGPPPPPQKLAAKAGLNRAVWDLRGEEAARFKGLILWSAETRGPIVPPGRYQVRLSAEGQTLTQPLEVKKDPRLATTDADFTRQYDLRRKIRDKLTETHEAIGRIREVREQVRSAADRSKAAGGAAVAAAAEALDKKLTGVEEALYQTKNQSSQDPLNFPIRLNNKLAALARVVDSADAAPTEQSQAVYDDLASKIDAQLAALAQVLSSDLASFNKLVREQDVPAVVIKPKA